MIYELAIVAKEGVTDEITSSLTTLVKDVVSQNDGEVLIEDDWGKRTFAQPTSKGVRRGHFLYYIYKSGTNANQELSRRFGINDHVLKNMIIVLGTDDQLEKIVKGYKTPFSRKYHGSVTDGQDEFSELERRQFSKRRQCWFQSRQIKADWKDPATYSWLVNDFGKINPSRVSGISVKHHRFANTAIKRARQIGIISHLTDEIAE